MNERNDLRALIKKNRAAISMIEVTELSARIAERVLSLPEYIRARRVLCYASTQTEVSTRGLLREILRSGRELYLPRVLSSTAMEAVRLRDISDLKRGATYDLDEPTGTEVLSPCDLDLLLVPGIAFDRRGGRLGYGAGYFDRFLPTCRGLIVGLSFELQLMDVLPMEAHDAYMDRVITEQSVYDCAARRASQS